MMRMWPSFHDAWAPGAHKPGGHPQGRFLPGCPSYFSVLTEFHMLFVFATWYPVCRVPPSL